MINVTAPTSTELEELDRSYREGGLREMASPQVHYDNSFCPQKDCGQLMEWIDFKLELHCDPEGVYKPLVRSWWSGTGFVGRCPSCGGWIRFTTMNITPCDEEDTGNLPHLPENWYSIAQIA